MAEQGGVVLVVFPDSSVRMYCTEFQDQHVASPCQHTMSPGGQGLSAGAVLADYPGHTLGRVPDPRKSNLRASCLLKPGSTYYLTKVTGAATAPVGLIAGSCKSHIVAQPLTGTVRSIQGVPSLGKESSPAFNGHHRLRVAAPHIWIPPPLWCSSSESESDCIVVVNEGGAGNCHEGWKADLNFNFLKASTSFQISPEGPSYGVGVHDPYSPGLDGPYTPWMYGPLSAPPLQRTMSLTPDLTNQGPSSKDPWDSCVMLEGETSPPGSCYPWGNMEMKAHAAATPTSSYPWGSSAWCQESSAYHGPVSFAQLPRSRTLGSKGETSRDLLLASFLDALGEEQACQTVAPGGCSTGVRSDSMPGPRRFPTRGSFKSWCRWALAFRPWPPMHRGAATESGAARFGKQDMQEVAPRSSCCGNRMAMETMTISWEAGKQRRRSFAGDALPRS